MLQAIPRELGNDALVGALLVADLATSLRSVSPTTMLSIFVFLLRAQQLRCQFFLGSLQLTIRLSGNWYGMMFASHLA